MDEQILRIIIPAAGLISGLIGAFVGLQNRALLAEVRKELAELENRIILRINGTYVRTSEGKLRDDVMQARIELMAAEIRLLETVASSMGGPAIDWQCGWWKADQVRMNPQHSPYQEEVPPYLGRTREYRSNPAYTP